MALPPATAANLTQANRPKPLAMAQLCGRDIGIRPHGMQKIPDKLNAHSVAILWLIRGVFA
eukprot:14710346-Alexandrium_andersonii.AAC.1